MLGRSLAGCVPFRDRQSIAHGDLKVGLCALNVDVGNFYIMEQILAGNIAKSKKPDDFKIVGEVLAVEPIAIMLRKDDPDFKKAVDTSLSAMMKSGEMAKIYDTWFMQPIPPINTRIGLPPSDATQAAWAGPNDKPMEDYAKQ